ncbi:MAG: hypothetical protein ACMXYK_01335 [Candidatus Woesearchaeota archaeon]
MKAQSEVMGLALIMVIITFGLALLVRFSLSSDSGLDSLDSYSREQIPLRLNSAMLQTHVEACGLDFSELLIRCAQGNAFTCPRGVDLQTGLYASPSALDACSAAARFANETLHLALGDRGGFFQYRMFAYVGEDYTDDSLWLRGFPVGNNLDCTYTNDRGQIRRMQIPHPGVFFFRISGSRLLTTKLDLCYRQ